MGLWIEVVWREGGDSCLGGDTEGCLSGDLLRGRGDREEKGGEGGEWGRLTDCNGDHETLGGEAGGGEGGNMRGKEASAGGSEEFRGEGGRGEGSPKSKGIGGKTWKGKVCFAHRRQVRCE